MAHHSRHWEALCLLIGYPREASVLPLGRFQSCDFMEGCILYFHKYKILLFDGQTSGLGVYCEGQGPCAVILDHRIRAGCDFGWLADSHLVIRGHIEAPLYDLRPGVAAGQWPGTKWKCRDVTVTAAESAFDSGRAKACHRCIHSHARNLRFIKASDLSSDRHVRMYIELDIPYQLSPCAAHIFRMSTTHLMQSPAFIS